MLVRGVVGMNFFWPASCFGEESYQKEFQVFLLRGHVTLFVAWSRHIFVAWSRHIFICGVVTPHFCGVIEKTILLV